ncbi:three prime repair exonuclease 4 [Cololabis saira]|uniref:three prime repair exonuclease 4 n=1 Tax=Cololabis saira TaxID=129043 RepID=UPI002AD52C38|nr:three prime repair exonuclease 4 [Cololabis saira]
MTTTGTRTVVFFDLETTGLDTSTCDIVQLAAVCGTEVFSRYVLPGQDIDPGATKVTGLSVSPEGQLLLRGVAVATVPLGDALASFLHFLGQFNRPVLLAAHNARRFDAPILTRVLQEHGLREQFQDLVSGFLDTLPLSRNLHPDLDRNNQPFLVQLFLGRQYDAHNALEDVRALQELYQVWNPNQEDVSRCSSQI